MASSSGPGIAALLGLALSLAACAPPEPGVEYAGERLDVVDMHLHSGEWSGIGAGTQRFLAERFPHPVGLAAERFANDQISAAGILEELDDAGIQRGVLFAVYAPRTVGVTPNGDIIASLATDPDRLSGFASLNVDRWDEDGAAAMDALDEALSANGMIGVKLAHAHQHMRFDDVAYWPIYEIAAARGAPVYLHTGSTPFPGAANDPAYTDPAYLEAAIAAHPDTVFVLGHLGYDFHNHLSGALETCLDLAARYDHVFLEPSALGSRGSDPEGENLPRAMRRIREDGLTDRVLYGSDGPQSPGFVEDYLERTVAAMEASDWTVAEARAALAGNFDRVFGTGP